jgi:hypothetical protein
MRGHEIYYTADKTWLYVNNNRPIDKERPCQRFGRKPTKEGYDVCLGYIRGVTSTCCGHGIIDPFFVKS